MIVTAIKRVQIEDRLLQQMQTNLIEAINPTLNNLLVQGLFLQKVSLSAGSNIIPTMLNRPLNGWFITRQRASASVYDTQDTNLTPSQNLVLVASAPVVVDLYVF